MEKHFEMRNPEELYISEQNISPFPIASGIDYFLEAIINFFFSSWIAIMKGHEDMMMLHVSWEKIKTDNEIEL